MDEMDRRTPLAAGLDTGIIVLFVAIGRREHEQDSAISGLVNTAAPFLIALAIAWMVLRVWRNPADWRMGVGVWAIVIAGGMLIRNLVFDDGTATSFVIVTSAFLGTFLIGWRVVVALLDRYRSRATA